MNAFVHLKAPFAPDRVSWRVGSTNKDKTKGLALAYIDARDVMNRLDEVVGPENWQDRYEVHGSKTICYLSLNVGYLRGSLNPSEWVTKADAAGDSDVEAEKGAISDAFKRAAVKWGIGRYLYDLDSPWVQLDDYKRIAQHEYKRLEALLRGDAKAPEPKAEKTPEQREAAAVKWATDFMAKRLLEKDTVGLDGENSEQIAAAAKYPKARAILEAAGVPL
jgi:hypothetical protein